MRLTRVTLFFIALIIGCGFYFLLNQQLKKVEPQIFQAMEESMVDSSILLAGMIESDVEHGGFDPERFRQAFTTAKKREFNALIHGFEKNSFGLGAYVTDSDGIVVFDSEGKREGMDLHARRDVWRTLHGDYGARSSKVEGQDSQSGVMYIGTLIGSRDKPWGVLSVYKSQSDVLPIVNSRRKDIYLGTGLIGAGILFLVTAVFIWQYRPISRLTEYARDIEQGKRAPLPPLGAGREVNTLANALESMREALEGRRYVERYIQTLTHEMKSPLAAIRGAAELMDENMPKEDRTRFLGNIRAETARAERLINRLLQLSAVEGKTRIESPEHIEVAALIVGVIDQSRPMADLRAVALSYQSPDPSPMIEGDPFILKSAVTNLMENAIDFAPIGTLVEIVVWQAETQIVIDVCDHGPGIPEYARDRIFERFYSLRHHQAGRKGTGLGLPLVKEAAELHGGSIELLPRDGGGTIARLKLVAC